MCLKQLYLNLSIKYKILLLFYCVVLLVSLVLSCNLYFVARNHIINKISSANLAALKQVNNNIEYLRKDIEDISTYLTINPVIHSVLKGEYSMTDTPATTQFYIDSSLEFIINLIASKSQISLLSIYDNKDVVYYSITDGSAGLSGMSAVKQTEEYEKALSMKGSPIWFLIPRDDKQFILDSRYDKIAMCRVIKDLNNFNEYIGFIIISVNESSIRSIYQNNIDVEKDENLVITDNRDKIISRSGGAVFNGNFRFTNEMPGKEGFFIERIEGQDFLVTYLNAENTGWKLFHTVPMKNILPEINSYVYSTLLMALFCLVISLPIMMLISTYLTSPIYKIVRSMKRFQDGNFDEKVRFRYNDEIGDLGNGFNNMVASIKQLIDKVYVLQIKEREAELKALQAQINPHFLYNVLDTLFWKLKNKGENEASEMVYSLSKIFRLTLNKGKGFTVVAKEKEFLEHYLMLQKSRFKEKLNYTIDMDAEILNMAIPKLLLQPFVENAILHGLENKNNGGSIYIEGNLCKDDKIRFVIRDDGIGMNEDKIGSLLNQGGESDINTSDVSGGYAIKNIDERLKLIYGDNYELNFSSEPGKGTTVEIIIPVIDDKTSQRGLKEA